MRIPAEVWGRQIQVILEAWGMTGEPVAVTVRMLLAADLRGIDSHGISILTLYDQFRRSGKLALAPVVAVVRETPVTALIDGGGGLGHYPSFRAMTLAIEKCARTGVAAVTVRNSTHFGAAGPYALLAAERGFVGLAASAVWRPAVAPTFAAEPMFGTNPIAFAAPAGRNPSFCLDMATSTVALGKIRMAALRGKPVPEGWAVDDQGRPLTDPEQVLQRVCLTPLGGTPELGSHKGYGLAAMIEILCTMLPGGLFAAARAQRDPAGARPNVGHFFLALDPRAFRDDDQFERDLDAMIDALHEAKRADPAQPVLVAGDLEHAACQDRLANGIPVGPELAETIRRIAEGCGAPFVWS